MRYYDTGDWVESCRALVEHWDGRLALVQAGGEAVEETDEAWPASLAPLVPA